MNQEKLIKSANTMYTIVNILEKVVLVGLVLIVLGAGLIFFVPKGQAVTMSKITVGTLTMELYDNAMPAESFQIQTTLIGMAAAAIICLMVFFGLRIVKDILAPMKEGRPFEHSVSLDIRKLGLLVLFGGIVGQGAMFATNFMWIHNLDLMTFFNREVVKSVTINNSFSLTFVFITLLLFLLSYVFEYGWQLQQESDETL